MFFYTQKLAVFKDNISINIVLCINVQRQHHLAAKRDSVLKSLRGLLKAGRGGRRRREASNNYL